MKYTEEQRTMNLATHLDAASRYQSNKAGRS
jgi:hypothetical protein